MPSEQTCPLFAPELARLDSPAAIAAYLKDWRGRINSADSLRDSTGTELMAHNTALVDAVLRRLFALAVERAGPGEGEPALAIIATGGYGRRELAPFSDVDVTFVPALEDDPYLNVLIKDMFQMVMDVFLYGANLKVGYAYRLLGDLGRLDHQTQTTLLDARLLCGDRALFTEFRSRFRAALLTADFLFQNVGRAAGRPAEARGGPGLRGRAERQGRGGRPARYPERRVDGGGPLSRRPVPALARPR